MLMDKGGNLPVRVAVLDGFTDALAQQAVGFRTDLARQHGKFIAADAADDGAFPAGASQHIARGAQQTIAHGMTEVSL